MSLEVGLVLKGVFPRRRHDKATIDHAVWILQLVDVFDRVHFLHGVQVVDHAIVARCDLQQVGVELHFEARYLFHRRKVPIRHFGHLDV